MIRPSSRTTTVRLGFAAVAALFTVAACGDDDDGGESADSAPATAGATEPAAVTEPAGATETPSSSAPASSAAASASSAAGGSAPASGGATVAIGDTELGSVLVDGEGMTLYLFLPDGQGASTCTDDCVETWPAVGGPATAGEGVDESLLATAVRPDDGSEQATYNGWPLYTFANDSAPGDINGQGLGDAWFVVDAAGEAVSSG